MSQCLSLCSFPLSFTESQSICLSVIYIVFGSKSNGRNKTCQVSTTVTFRPWFAQLQQTQLVLSVISKPLFGEASLSEQWENIQCIAIGSLWFLFILHLLCLAIAHRNDSMVHCINSQTTWLLFGLCGNSICKC